MNKKQNSALQDHEWKVDSFPYETDYCDHFETPREAYQDLAPVLSYLESKQRGHGSKSLRIYDPYYCHGQAASLLQDLGHEVIHAKRDFYKDIQETTVPDHDVLVTNPPYSDDHKKKCLQFCFDNLLEGRPFAILLPNYVSARQYYREMAVESVAYLVPQTRYSFLHPEGTGKQSSPFESMWFIGIGSERVDEIKEVWKETKQSTENGSSHLAELVTSLGELSTLKSLVSMFKKRPNPRQRNKRAGVARGQGNVISAPAQKACVKKAKNDTRSSKYRDREGRRKRRRF